MCCSFFRRKEPTPAPPRRGIRNPYILFGFGLSELGLAICQRIIEAHQGKIEVKSEVGKWTIFVVKLPVSTIDKEVV
ncbi:hypothetical protein KKE26_04720 [bacterium]|nr:hypothetical protein [bacterium]MBU1753214.1 hypothetical protein [bacterium]